MNIAASLSCPCRGSAALPDAHSILPENVMRLPEFERRVVPLPPVTSLAQAILPSTLRPQAEVPKPQQQYWQSPAPVPPLRHSAQCARLPTGCSTKLVVLSRTPGIITLSSGNLTSRQTFHSWAWRGLAPSNEMPQDGL